MYQEKIAALTRDLLLTDINTFLTDEEARHTDDRISLVKPVRVDVATIIGGVIGVEPKTLPQYAIDCGSKEQGGEFDEYEFVYSGQLSYLVGSPDLDTVDKLVKRHGAALERWVKAHRFFHQATQNTGDEFRIAGLLWTDTAFMGAAEMSGDDQKPHWYAGGVLGLAWQVFEGGEGQHG